jgi:hypothetical protein
VRSELRVLRAVLLALVVVVLTALPGRGWASEEPTATPTPTPSDNGSVVVDDAVLGWGMSNEANNAAFAPGTFNFFSAGKIADPGKGNVQLAAAGWSQHHSNVAIQKWNGSAYAPATWAGLRTDAGGTVISGPGSGRFSDHQFVFSGGVGTVDADAGTAHVGWTGDVTVLFYSGFTFFYLSDPVLDVADGAGTLTATLSGFGSTRDNPGSWTAIAPKTVTVADLPDVDLDDVAGFNATPAYDAVTTTLDGVATTGSFPQSFVGFMNDVGTAPFWMRSGSSTDAAKKALPITVSYDASRPVDTPAPPKHTPAPVVHNDSPERPRTNTVTVTRTTTVTLPAAPAAPAAAPAAASAPWRSSRYCAMPPGRWRIPPRSSSPNTSSQTRSTK